jgi:hypothetical protein
LRRIDSPGPLAVKFLVVLPDCSAQQALRVLDKIRRFAGLTFVPVAAGSR